MSYNIIPTHKFEKELKRLIKKFPSLKKEFAVLIENVSENPVTGKFIGNHCYKIRIAIASKGTGNRGGARIITYLYIQTETVYLLTIHDKSEKEDVSENDLQIMILNLEL